MYDCKKIIWFIFIVFVFAGCAGKKTEKEYKSINDIRHAKIACVSNTIYDKFVEESLPDAIPMRYDDNADIIIALEKGKADIALLGEVRAGSFIKTRPDLEIAFSNLFSQNMGIGFKKGDTLRLTFNRYLAMIKRSGKLKEIYNRWIGSDVDMARMPAYNIPSDGMPLIVGTLASSQPFSYVQNNTYVGYDIEVMNGFAEYLKRPVKYLDIKFNGLIAALQTDKIDVLAACLAMNPERKSKIDFSDTYFVSPAAVVVVRRQGEHQFAKMDDVSRSRIGVMMGSIYDKWISERYPKSKLMRIDEEADLNLALITKKCDVAIFPFANAKVILAKNNNVGVLSDSLFPVQIGAAFAKGKTKIKNEFNKFLADIKKSGEYEGLFNKWFGPDMGRDSIVNVVCPKSGKNLRIGTSTGSTGFVAYRDGKYVGFDIDLIERFAAKYGYTVDISDMKFAALIPSLASGRVDVILSSITITPERSAVVDFSDSYMEMNAYALALKENLAGADNNKDDGNAGFMQNIKKSFYDNIILENRYKLIISGFKETMIISLFSILLGTIMGSLICFLRMGKNSFWRVFAKGYISIMRGTPLLVFLMIMYYVIFASTTLNATIVAIIAFAMNFGAYVSEMFRSAIEGIDRGQSEAGVAMGFTKIQTFVYIVAPQAIKRVVPVYKGEVISLVKSTSIVGYIAIQDLTKASDIIRSRTFDAFFPLIFIAVIYFILAWALGLLLELLNKKLSK